MSYIYRVHLPFCSIYKCSHKISPVNGGAIAKNPSLPNPTISRPCIFKNGSMLTISKENSRFAHFNHMTTCSEVHCRGSENKYRKDIVISSYFFKPNPSTFFFYQNR